MPESKQKSNRIIIKYRDKYYSFLSFVLNNFDGSFYIFFTRKGVNNQFFNFKLIDNKPVLESIEKETKRGIEIHCHASGRINFRGKTEKIIFLEPLFQISEPFQLMTISLPEIIKLDLHQKNISERDHVIDITDNNYGRINFSIVIAPWNYLLNSDEGSCVRYKELFCLYILINKEKIQTDTTMDEHFIYAFPERGIHQEQVCENDIALLIFHQKIQATKNIIIYSPDTKGTYTLIFSNQMRIPPRATIEFENKNLYADFSDLPHRTTCLRFQVKDHYGNIIKEERRITKIELDAEL